MPNVALAALCAASFAVGCDDGDKKTAEPAPSASAAPLASAAPVAPAAPKPSEVITASLKSVVAAWNAHDAAKVAAGYEPGATLVIPGSPPVVGHDAVQDAAKGEFTAYPDFKVAITRAFISGHSAVFEWVVTGKNDGPPAPGQKPTGRSIGISGVSLATFDDAGLMKEDHRYFDGPTIGSQLDPKAKAGTFVAPVTMPTAEMEVHVSKGTPDEAKTVADGNAILKADETKDDKALLATVNPDYVWIDNTSPTPITQATLVSVQGGYNKAFPDWTMTPTTTMAADGYYVVEVTFAGTQKGPMGPIKASNKPVKTSMIDIQLLKDGKASKEWSYFNSADLLTQIGAMPAAPAAPPAAAVAAAATK
jgi:predicted ester cyclase